MKILVFSWFYPPIVGGTENIARAGVEGLVALGHEIVVLTSAGLGAAESCEHPAPGYRIIRWPVLHPRYPDGEGAQQVKSKLGSLLRTENFDLVHSHLLTYPLAPLRADALIGAFRQHNLRLIDQAHGGTYERDPQACARLMPQPDLFISDSYYVERRVRRFFESVCTSIAGEQAKLPPIVVLHPSIIAREFRRDPALRETVRRQLGLSLEDFTVFFPSRFFDIDGSISVAKRADVALRAFGQMCREIPGAMFVAAMPPGFSGEGLEVESRRRIQELLAELEIENRVRLLNRAIPHSEMPNFFNAADATLVPSIEGFGLVYIESMACGVPVVGVADGAAPEVVQDSGLLVEPGDQLAEHLGAALVDLAKNPDRRSALVSRAIELIRTEHDHDRWIMALQDILVGSFMVTGVH